MLPAPTTTATSTPLSATSVDLAGDPRRPVRRSVPYSSEPIRASPESLSRIRLKTGSAIGAGSAATPRRPESARSARSTMFSPVLAASSSRSSSIVLPSCRSERMCSCSRRATSFDHFASWPSTIFSTMSRACPPRLLSPRRPCARLRRPPRGSPPPRRTAGRRRAGDVQRDLAGELLEVVVARDEVRLALDLDHRRRPCRSRGCRRRPSPPTWSGPSAWRPRPDPSRAGSRPPCPCRLRPRSSADLASMTAAPGALPKRLDVAAETALTGASFLRRRWGLGLCRRLARLRRLGVVPRSLPEPAALAASSASRRAFSSSSRLRLRPPSRLALRLLLGAALGLGLAPAARGGLDGLADRRRQPGRTSGSRRRCPGRGSRPAPGRRSSRRGR